MSVDTESLAVAGTLDALRKTVDELFKFLRRRVTSRGGVPSNVTADVRRVELLAQNNYRHMATIFNDSTAVLSLALGSFASLDSFTLQIAPGGYYETPAGYIGPITGVWAAVNGRARVTELA